MVQRNQTLLPFSFLQWTVGVFLSVKQFLEQAVSCNWCPKRVMLSIAEGRSTDSRTRIISKRSEIGT